MELQTHAKIGIWVGIVAIIIGMSFFTLHESQQLKYEYGRLFVNEAEMYDKLATTGSADVFIERFPYFYEEFDIRRDGSARLELYAFNNVTNNRLDLSIRYDQDDDKLRERANCDYSNIFWERMEMREAGYATSASMDRSIMAGASIPMPEPFMPYLGGHAEDRFVQDFIKSTECMEVPDWLDMPNQFEQVMSEPEPTPHPEPER
jgi:hypothetical protein